MKRLENIENKKGIRGKGKKHMKRNEIEDSDNEDRKDE